MEEDAPEDFSNSFLEGSFEEDPPLPIYASRRELFASPSHKRSVRSRDLWGRGRKDSFGVDISVEPEAETEPAAAVVNPFDQSRCENFPQLDSAFDIPLSEEEEEEVEEDEDEVARGVGEEGDGSDSDCSDASLELKYELSNEPEFGTPMTLNRQFSTTEDSYTSPVNEYFKSVPMTALKTPYRESGSEARENRQPNVVLFQ